MGQLRTLGASLDYPRHRFTMDDAYSAAVMRFFEHLMAEGVHLPRVSHRQLVPGLSSTVSDLEVKHRELDDTLTWIRYPLVGGDAT